MIKPQNLILTKKKKKLQPPVKSQNAVWEAVKYSLIFIIIQALFLSLLFIVLHDTRQKNRENTETVKNVVTKTNEISNAEQPKINQNQRKFRKNKADFEETFEENITAKSNESLQENEYINIEIGKSNSTETAVQTESKGSLLKRFFIKKANK